MPSYELVSTAHLFPTPAGAFYAVSAADPEPARVLLLNLLREARTFRIDTDQLLRWSEAESAQDALAVLYEAQANAWVQGEELPRDVPGGSLETDAPRVLALLSSEGRGLLCDSEGFYLSRSGITHEHAEEIALLAADIGIVMQRREALLARSPGFGVFSWGAVDNAGNSRIGFWPLHVGSHRFSLVLLGAPRLNQPALTELVWLLAHRYA